MTRAWMVVSVLSVGACTLPETVERNCAERRAFYPDEDGDGVGEPTDVYIGCEAPEGWVDVVGSSTWSYPTPTGDTGAAATGDTGTTANGDTTDTSTADTADTSTADTADTGTADTADTGQTETGDTGA